MSEFNKYNLDSISEEDSFILIARMLKMAKDNDVMFTCISDQITSDLMLHDYIDIDLENETIEGTTLTKKRRENIIQ